MKKVRCPKCDEFIAFDETRYKKGQSLVFECPACHKQFGIRIGKSERNNINSASNCGNLIVVENVFHHKQIIPLRPGDNVIGRYIKGTTISTPIQTHDPSMDTKHCIINVKKNKNGTWDYILRDAPSLTGTFYMNNVLSNYDRVKLADGSIITLGATTLILRINNEQETLLTNPANEL